MKSNVGLFAFKLVEIYPGKILVENNALLNFELESYTYRLIVYAFSLSVTNVLIICFLLRHYRDNRRNAELLSTTIRIIMIRLYFLSSVS